MIVRCRKCRQPIEGAAFGSARFGSARTGWEHIGSCPPWPRPPTPGEALAKYNPNNPGPSYIVPTDAEGRVIHPTRAK